MKRINLRSPQTQKSADPKNLTRLVVQEQRLRLGSRGRPLLFARFADGLNQHMRDLGISVSYQSIKNWEDGVNRPDYFFTQQLANRAPDGSWQRTFAMDILAVQWPALYKPGGEIGTAVLWQYGG